MNQTFFWGGAFLKYGPILIEATLTRSHPQPLHSIHTYDDASP